MKRGITIDLIVIKNIVKKYDEQLYAYKFDTLDSMGNFLERHTLLTLAQGEMKNVSKAVICTNNQNTIQGKKLRPRELRW